MTPGQFHASQKTIATRFGEIAYVERGEGPPALFVHGIFLNGYLWRHVMDDVSDMRRCIAIDLLGHGGTKIAPGQKISFTAQAECLAAVCDALYLESVDLVANDTGGGVAQIFASLYPDRLRSLTLTNCDTHDNYPPAALKPLMDTVAAGKLAELGHAMLADVNFARETLSIGYEHPENLSPDTIKTYLEPLFSTPERVKLFEQWFTSLDDNELAGIEPRLRSLHVPTLIVWGTGDVFFDIKWAHWLRAALPGARDVVVLEGAKLFFPEERSKELSTQLRSFWSSKGLAHAE